MIKEGTESRPADMSRVEIAAGLAEHCEIVSHSARSDGSHVLFLRTKYGKDTEVLYGVVTVANIPSREMITVVLGMARFLFNQQAAWEYLRLMTFSPTAPKPEGYTCVEVIDRIIYKQGFKKDS